MLDTYTGEKKNSYLKLGSFGVTHGLCGKDSGYVTQIEKYFP